MSGGGALGLGSSSSYNTSQQQSQGTSESVGGSSQQVFGADYYAKLFGGASAAAQSGLANGDVLGSAARDLFTGGTNFLSMLSKGNPSAAYEADRLNGPNTALEDAITAMGGDESRFLTQNALPTIASNSVASGTLGNDRQGVAQGVAISNANSDFLSKVATLRANDVNERDTVAANLAGQTVQSAATGLGALPSMMDLLTNSAAPQLGIYKNLAGILGGPTTLTDQFSKSFSQQSSSGQSYGHGHSWNFNMAAGGGVGGGAVT